jgi:hypothetical protein
VAERKIFNLEEQLAARWYAMPDDVIGGWCVMPDEKPPSLGGWQIADFVSQEIAEHIAELHNAYILHGRSWE